MKDETTVSKRLGLALAGGALLTALPLGLSVNKNGAPAIAWRDACAASVSVAALVDGSCAPKTGWICGLNGQNYPDKRYVAC